MSRKQHRNGKTGKDRDYGGQTLNQKHEEMLSEGGKNLVATKAEDEEHVLEGRNTTPHDSIFFLFGLLKEVQQTQNIIRQSSSHYYICHRSYRKRTEESLGSFTVHIFIQTH